MDSVMTYYAILFAKFDKDTFKSVFVYKDHNKKSIFDS